MTAARNQEHDVPVDPALDALAAAFLYREVRCLDERDWDGWLSLFAEDAVYWVPAWRDESVQTDDPDREISQIFHDSRRGLEERVARVRSAKSVTTMPLARTTHFVTNVSASTGETGELCVHACWQVQVYEPRTARQYANFGRYEMALARRDAALEIRRKTIRLINDRVPTLIDFYTL